VQLVRGVFAPRRRREAATAMAEEGGS